MIGEAELLQRLLARGWVRPEQLEPLRRMRHQGDPRPLPDLLVGMRLVTPAQLQELLGVHWPSGPISPAGSSRPVGPAASSRGPRAELAEGQPLPLRPGLTVSVERVLGRGGMGIVYLVRDPQLGRRAALKLIRTPTEARRLRFAREVSVTARLDHPGIPPVFEAGRTPDDQDYLLMHYVAGESLAAQLERLPSGPAAWRPALEALVKVAEAVHYAHSRRVVHRDLKPDNLMLGAFGEVYVMDWGLARDLEESLSADARAREEMLEGAPGSALLPGAPRLTRDGIIVGTPGYMAPEQARQEEIGPAADVFSLGCVLSCVLVGQPPFAGKTPLELISELERGALLLPRQRDRRVPPELDAIAAAALHPDPRRRYPHAQALGSDLKAFLSGQPVSVYRYGRAQQTLRLVRAHPTLFASLGLLFLLSLLGVWGASRAREAAIAQERQAAVQAAALEAEHAWAALAAVDSAGSAGPESAARARRVGLALEALTAAQRWHALAPADPAARLRRFEAASALGAEALADEQWALAERAYQAALGLGIDDQAARTRLDGVQERRRARTAHALAEARRLLGEAEQGALERRPDGLVDATFALTRTGEPEVAGLLAARLEEIARACLAVTRELILGAREPTPTEAAAGARPLEGLEAALEAAFATDGRTPQDEQLRLLEEAGGRMLLRHQAQGGKLASFVELAGDAHARRLGPQLRVARLCCEALGRLGVRGEPEAALELYLRAELDPGRLYPAALALHRLAGHEAVPALVRLIVLHARRPTLVDQLLPLLPPEARLSTAEDSDESALQMMRLERWAEAVEAYTRLVARQPQRAELWAQLGVCRSGLGDLEGAERCLTRALELDPSGNPQAWGMRGSVRGRLGRLEEARADQERAVELAPQDARLWFNLSNLRQRTGDTEGARAALDRTLTLDPTLVRAWINRSALRCDQRDFAGAEADLRRALELAPRDPLVLQNLGRALRLQGKLLPARQFLDEAVTLGPERAQAWFQRGLLRHDQGDPSGARDDLARAAELDPAHGPTWTQLAFSQHALGQPEQARASAERAVRLDPETPASWAVLGNVAIAQDDLQRADEAMRRGREVAPEEPALLALEGYLALVRGQSAQAVRLLRQAVERDPTRVESWLLLADGYLAEGDPPRARAAYAEAAPHCAGPRLTLGRIVAEIADNDLPAVHASVAEVLATAPERSQPGATALGIRGWLRALEGDPQGAQDARRALQLAPYHGPVWVYGLITLLTLERDEEARRMLEQVERTLAVWDNYALGTALLACDLELARPYLRRARSSRGRAGALLMLHCLGESPDAAEREELLAAPDPNGASARYLLGESPEPPEWPLSWLCAGLQAEVRGDREGARRWYERARSGDPITRTVARRRLELLAR